MVVLRVPIVVFIDTSPVQFKSIEQASIDKLSQSSIHRRAGDVICISLGWELFHQLVSIKMLMPIKNLFNQKLALLCVSQAFALLILIESLQRSHRYLNGFERCRWDGAFGSHRFVCVPLCKLVWAQQYIPTISRQSETKVNENSTIALAKIAVTACQLLE